MLNGGEFAFGGGAIAVLIREIEVATAAGDVSAVRAATSALDSLARRGGAGGALAVASHARAPAVLAAAASFLADATPEAAGAGAPLRTLAVMYPFLPSAIRASSVGGAVRVCSRVSAVATGGVEIGGVCALMGALDASVVGDGVALRVALDCVRAVRGEASGAALVRDADAIEPLADLVSALCGAAPAAGSSPTATAPEDSPAVVAARAALRAADTQAVLVASLAVPSAPASLLHAGARALNALGGGGGEGLGVATAVRVAARALRAATGAEDVAGLVPPGAALILGGGGTTSPVVAANALVAAVRTLAAALVVSADSNEGGGETDSLSPETFAYVFDTLLAAADAAFVAVRSAREVSVSPSSPRSDSVQPSSAQTSSPVGRIGADDDGESGSSSESDGDGGAFDSSRSARRSKAALPAAASQVVGAAALAAARLLAAVKVSTSARPPFSPTGGVVVGVDGAGPTSTSPANAAVAAVTAALVAPVRSTDSPAAPWEATPQERQKWGDPRGASSAVKRSAEWGLGGGGGGGAPFVSPPISEADVAALLATALRVAGGEGGERLRAGAESLNAALVDIASLARSAPHFSLLRYTGPLPEGTVGVGGDAGSGAIGRLAVALGAPGGAWDAFLCVRGSALPVISSGVASILSVISASDDACVALRRLPAVATATLRAADAAEPTAIAASTGTPGGNELDDLLSERPDDFAVARAALLASAPGARALTAALLGPSPTYAATAAQLLRVLLSAPGASPSSAPSPSTEGPSFFRVAARLAIATGTAADATVPALRARILAEEKKSHSDAGDPFSPSPVADTDSAQSPVPALDAACDALARADVTFAASADALARVAGALVVCAARVRGAIDWTADEDGADSLAVGGGALDRESPPGVVAARAALLAALSLLADAHATGAALPPIPELFRSDGEKGGGDFVSRLLRAPLRQPGGRSLAIAGATAWSRVRDPSALAAAGVCVSSRRRI